MDDKQLDALKFAVNEKANQAQIMMSTALTSERIEFWRGQYMAFNEIYSLLNNV